MLTWEKFLENKGVDYNLLQRQQQQTQQPNYNPQPQNYVNTLINNIQALDNQSLVALQKSIQTMMQQRGLV